MFPACDPGCRDATFLLQRAEKDVRMQLLIMNSAGMQRERVLAICQTCPVEGHHLEIQGCNIAINSELAAELRLKSAISEV